MEIKEAMQRLEYPATHTIKNENREACIMAIKALGKRKPMKPYTTQRQGEHMPVVTEYWCSSCDAYINNSYDMRYGNRGNYCKWCGQAINWGDIDEC